MVSKVTYSLIFIRDSLLFFNPSSFVWSYESIDLLNCEFLIASIALFFEILEFRLLEGLRECRENASALTFTADLAVSGLLDLVLRQATYFNFLWLLETIN